MKIGLLLPSVLMSQKYSDRIFAPKDLFLSLANGLVKKGHDVYVYSASQIDTVAKLISGNQLLEREEYYSIKDKDKAKGLVKDLSFVRQSQEYELELTARAFAHANKNNLDIMHVYLGYLSNYFVNFSKTPVVFTLHDPVSHKETLEAFRFTLFPNLNYISISNSQKTNYKKAFGVRTINTIYHGLNLINYEFAQKPQDYVAFMGRYIPEKGVKDAINTAISLKMSLKLASSGNYKTNPYYLENIKPFLSSAVEENSYFSTKRGKSEFLKNAKALLFPIQWEEPFGMVMIEAMACGTPVIAYNRGSVSELVRDGVTGFVVDPPEEDLQVQSSPLRQDFVGQAKFKVQNEGKWVIKEKGIKGLIEAVGRIGEIDRKNCRKHIEENFTVEKMAEGYEEVYKKIINK